MPRDVAGVVLSLGQVASLGLDVRASLTGEGQAKAGSQACESQWRIMRYLDGWRIGFPLSASRFVPADVAAKTASYLAAPAGRLRSAVHAGQSAASNRSR